MMDQPRAVIAIPVCNEIDRIGPCLLSLSRQQPRVDGIVLLLNNCTDGTARRVREVSSALNLPVRNIECDLNGAEANAGFARAFAMQTAGAELSDHDILITTDADGQVAPSWLGNNLRALRHADAVCGRAEIDPLEASRIPAHLHEDDTRERQLIELMDEVAAILDPQPHDPWPRHAEHSGASIAVRVGAWRRAGGIPRVPCGEDRAFIDNLRRIDARIRHDPTVRVTVSGRTVGRASGGMADTIRRRMVRQDEFADAAVEPAADGYRRICLCAEARMLWTEHAGLRRPGCAGLAAKLEIPATIVEQALSTPFFGAAWDDLQRHSALLHRRPVRFIDLPAEIAAAMVLNARARRRRDQPRPFMRADRSPATLIQLRGEARA